MVSIPPVLLIIAAWVSPLPGERLCAVVSNPARYSRRIVSVEATVTATIHGTYLREKGCERSLLVVLPDEIPDYRGPIRTVKDPNFDEFARARLYSPARQPSEFFAVFTGQIEFSNRPRFGYYRNRTSRLVLQSVKRPSARICDFRPYRPVRISSDWLHRGGVVKRVEPEYPPEAKSAGVHGRIDVRVLINSEGNVEHACGTGDAALLHAAEAAAKGWKFRVPKLNGTPLPYLEEMLALDFVVDRP
jgi:TonB family protein